MGASEIVASLFAITKHSLSIWDNKLAHKYSDRVIRLETWYYAEENKDEEHRNHAFMDNILNELCLITQTITNFKQ